MEKPIIKKITNEPWINLFKVNYILNSGKESKWCFASRRKRPLSDGYENICDAITIVPIRINSDGCKEIVLIKEFRAPLNGYEIGFPAGLVEEGEEVIDAARRELKEETGLNLDKVYFCTPSLYSSPGLTDENVPVMFVEASGQISTEYLEETEDIKVFTIALDQVEKHIFIDKNLFDGKLTNPIQASKNCNNTKFSSRAYFSLLLLFLGKDTLFKKGMVKVHEKEYHRICRICNTPQFPSPSGFVCKNGHGGAECYSNKVPDYYEQYQEWYQKIKTEISISDVEFAKAMKAYERKDFWHF